MIGHHSVKNLVVGAIVTGTTGPCCNPAMCSDKKVEVFNPFNQRVCEMPDLPGNEHIFGFY